MLIETERLRLRNYKETDSFHYYLLQSNELVWKYSTNTPIVGREEAKNKLLKEVNRKDKEIGFCALHNKEMNTYIGEAGILSYNAACNRCVIGYNLLPVYWNNGYATEIVKGLLVYAFEKLGVERVEALVMDENVASSHVLQKAGMIQEGKLKRYARVKNQYFDGYYDVLYYGLVKDDFAIML